jgi:hypothetical protein
MSPAAINTLRHASVSAAVACKFLLISNRLVAPRFLMLLASAKSHHLCQMACDVW